MLTGIDSKVVFVLKNVITVSFLLFIIWKASILWFIEIVCMLSIITSSLDYLDL